MELKSLKFLLILTCMIFLVGTVSALVTKEVQDDGKTIILGEKSWYDLFGWGEEEIMELQLRTNFHENLWEGYRMFAEINITSQRELDIILESIKTYDKNEEDWENHQLEKIIDVKYKIIKEEFVNETYEICNAPEDAIIYGLKCETKERSILKNVTYWEEFNNSLEENQSIIIGLFTWVNSGDYVEWIPEFYGKEIEEWATYSGAGSGTEGDPYQITTWAQLNEIRDHPSSYFILMNDLNSSDVGYYASWTPIASFTGDLDGNGHIIYDLYHSGGTGIGFFGGIGNGAYVHDIGFFDAEFRTNTYYQGIVAGTWNSNAIIERVMLSGYLYNSRGDYAGAGGVAGFCSGCTGHEVIDVAVDVETYSTGNYPMGGLWGQSGTTTTFNRTYARGFSTNTHAQASSHIEGTEGACSLSENGYYDSTVEPTLTSCGGTGKTTTQMKNQSTYVGWDFENIWNINEEINEGYPYLRILWDDFGEGPQINLESPENYYNQSNLNNIEFIFNVTDDIKVENVSLYINGILNETNSSGINGTYSFVRNLGEGEWNWSVNAWDNETFEENSETRYLTIDISIPDLNLTNPLAGTYTDEYTTSNNNSVQLNWTVSDTHLDSCWYSNDSGATNNSLTCGDNTTTLYFPYGSHSLDIWANDTFGNVAHDSVNFILAYKIFENSVDYSNQTYETARESFAINVTLGEAESISAYLIYNGSAYSSTRTGSSQTYLFSNSLILDQPGNNSFHWMFNYGGDYINSSTFYQNVSEISFTNCTSGTKFLTIELRDEETQNLLSASDNITMKANLLYYLEDISVNKTFNNSFTSNTVSFCLTPATENVSVFGEIEYDDDTHVKRRYYLLYDTFSNSTTTLPLYDLKSTDSTSFVVYLEDSSSVGVGDAYMELKKKYLEIDKYKVVEMAKTDEYGMSILHFVSEDDKYVMNFYDEDGNLLYSAPEFPAVCLDTVCSLTFKIPYSISLDPFSSITEDPNFEYILTMTDEDVITLVFNSEDGQGYNVLFDVYGMSIINDTVSICEESETNSASGTLTCDVSAQNFETFLVRIWINGDLQVSRYISPEDDTWQSYGKEGLIYTLFIVIILSLLFAWDWRLCLIGTVAGLAVSAWLKFIPGTISTISYIVVVVIYLILQGGDK